MHAANEEAAALSRRRTAAERAGQPQPQSILASVLAERKHAELRCAVRLLQLPAVINHVRSCCRPVRQCALDLTNNIGPKTS